MSTYRIGHNLVVYACSTLCFCLLCGIPARADQTSNAPSNADSGVTIQIVTNSNDPIFPPEWSSASLVVKATPLPSELADRSIQAVQQALAKYPGNFLHKSLSTVFIAGSLCVNGVHVGARNWPAHKAIYLARDVSTESWLGTLVHHELAHILYQNHRHNLSLKRWQQLNVPDFQYGKGSLEAIRAGTADGDMEESWLQRGFVRRYATSDVDEDFACICEELWSGDPAFWQAVDRYEVLRRKVSMAIAFYHSLGRHFTEAFFRAIKAEAPIDPDKPSEPTPG